MILYLYKHKGFIFRFVVGLIFARFSNYFNRSPLSHCTLDAYQYVYVVWSAPGHPCGHLMYLTFSLGCIQSEPASFMILVACMLPLRNCQLFQEKRNIQNLAEDREDEKRTVATNNARKSKRKHKLIRKNEHLRSVVHNCECNSSLIRVTWRA